MSYFDLLVLVLNKNHVDIKIDREKFTHHYCRSNPIRDGPLCLKPKNYSGALNILVLNGSHHVAAATWRESKNFFPLFSFSSPSSLHVSCTAAAAALRTMEKKGRVIFPFFQDNRHIKLLSLQQLGWSNSNMQLQCFERPGLNFCWLQPNQTI